MDIVLLHHFYPEVTGKFITSVNELQLLLFQRPIPYVLTFDANF